MARQLTFHVLGLYLDKLERAFSLDAEDLKKIYHQRAAQCIKRGGYDAAISTCLKALALNDDDVEARYQLGVAYMGNRSVDKAIDSFKKVLKLDPGRAGAHFRLGVLYEKASALDDAVASYKKAIKLADERA
ncbi:hypothetical protein LCGC14_1925370, partial [marine sediment metagenome]